MWTRESFWRSFEEVSLALEWWRALLSVPSSSDFLCEYVDFWEELSVGWMREYIWPYDDMYNPTVSHERKLRLGRR
jgi:hypothetical protein